MVTLSPIITISKKAVIDNVHFSQKIVSSHNIPIGGGQIQVNLATNSKNNTTIRVSYNLSLAGDPKRTEGVSFPSRPMTDCGLDIGSGVNADESWTA